MEAAEIRRLTAVEDRHWWYRERRAILGRELGRLAGPPEPPGAPGPPRPGVALDIGAAGGGNTRVLRAHGWQAFALDFSADAAEIGRARGIDSVRADARELPVGSGCCDLVTAFDVLEHIDEDHLVTAEIARVLRPGGHALIAVPCDMRLWSAHDEACGHVRRYTRAGLADVVQKAGLTIERVWSWNVLMRPVVAWRRRSLTGSDLDDPPPLVNAALNTIIVAERYLPVRSLPGVSLMLRARLA